VITSPHPNSDNLASPELWEPELFLNAFGQDK
jgi:hypothetical protein